MKSSLEHKTVRPGSLSSYSFYYSKRLPVNGELPVPETKNSRSFSFGKLFILLAILVAGYFGFQQAHLGASPSSNQENPAAVASTNPCSDNNLDKFIKVSISKRHLWACQGSKIAYNTPVVTGMSQYASTVTPTGTYKVYAKQQNTVLTGSDVTGSWRDPVAYWMPFLNNQYGTYGFHDATWRNSSQFGNIDPNSNQASHGCVELPLNAAAWLYSWVQVGTTLTIQA